MIRDELWAAVTETLDDIWALDWQWQRLVIGGTVAAILMTILAWKLMVPFLLLAFGVTFYLRRSRGSNSL